MLDPLRPSFSSSVKWAYYEYPPHRRVQRTEWNEVVFLTHTAQDKQAINISILSPTFPADHYGLIALVMTGRLQQ